ncbi:ribosomal protein L7/L12 [Streptomyces tirandamycinicus]|uniref:ribosomal protein L7/L12 n=1 Tax=Streptomyces tirandamycinicus TaxID=2174846 RepID=UPI0034198E21
MAVAYFRLECDDTPHDVVLTYPGRAPALVQVVRRLTGRSLWDSEVLATRIPAVSLGGAPRKDGAAAVAALRAARARGAETRERPAPDLPEH